MIDWETIDVTANIERRLWKPKKYIGELHRRRYIFDCPFCGKELTGFCLNLNGTGKRCKCGSLSCADFTTYERSPWRKSDCKNDKPKS